MHQAWPRVPKLHGYLKRGRKSYTGRMMGVNGDQRLFDVHVHGGTAYTAGAGRNDLVSGAIILAVVTGVCAYARWGGRRRAGR